MIGVLHWLASLVVLSVALAQLEAIKITTTGAVRLVVRAIGWSMLGLDAFATVIGPFFPWFSVGYRLANIGIAVLAISYQWQGATRHVRDR